MAKIGSLNIDLLLETFRFRRELDETETRMQRARAAFGEAARGMAAAFTVGAVVQGLATLREMSLEALEVAGSLGEQAAALGVSTTALQEYRAAAVEVGVSSDEMDTALAQLTRRVGDAALGTGEAGEALERLGVNFRDADGNIRSTEELLPLIAEGMRGIESPAEQAAIAVDLFGLIGPEACNLAGRGRGGDRTVPQSGARNGHHHFGGGYRQSRRGGGPVGRLKLSDLTDGNTKAARKCRLDLLFESALAMPSW